jgi:hypothetical protein
MLMVAVFCAVGCTKPNDPNDPNNGGNNGGNGGGNGNGGTLPAGIYLGVIGFNQQLHVKPITRLDATAIQETKQFIDNLQLGGATLLYHAVNTSLDMLASSGIPMDLINVSIVNFTDGLDEGSYTMNSNYSSGAQYLQAVTQRIRNERIHGDTIMAHTIGTQGNDVYSYDLVEFLNNLNGISSLPSEEYVHYVTDFSEVQAYFREIAENLHQQSINSTLTLYLPVPDPNTRIRFCLDITTPPPHAPDEVLQSEHYIEGVYVNSSDGKGVLTGVQYVGMSSTSGNTVTAVSMDPPFAVFKFEGMRDTNNNNFTDSTIANLQEWKYNINANAWIHNSEWTNSGNTEVTNDYYSSLIMLNLDCSESLGAQKFRDLKTYAKEFVDILRTN